jgi:hypothetical protein
MSLAKSALPLEIEITRSYYLCLFITLSHVAAIAAVAFTAIDSLLRVILIGAIFISLYRSWNPAPPFPRLRRDSQGQWWLHDHNGSEYRAELLPGAYVHPWLVILRFRVNLATHDLILLPDNVNGDQLRRLRVHLKHDV